MEMEPRGGSALRGVVDAPVKGPRVSVLMAVYNGEAYLEEALDSLLGQTWRDFELVVVEDGSTDGTPDILQRYARADGRIVMVENPKNLGLVKSLNRGLAVCRGEYVARADADDVALPERLERQVRFLDERGEVGLLACAFYRMDAEGRVLKAMHPPTDDRFIRLRQLFMSSFVHSGVMFRRELVASVGGYDENCVHMEDVDLWARLREHTRMANLAEPLVYYRVHTQSIMQTRDAAARERSLGVPRRLQSAYLGRPVEREASAAMTELYQGFQRLDAATIELGLRGLKEIARQVRAQEDAATRMYFRREVAQALHRQATMQPASERALRMRLWRAGVAWWPPLALRLARQEVAPRMTGHLRKAAETLGVWERAHRNWRRWERQREQFPNEAEGWLEPFREARGHPQPEDYAGLVRYFAQAWVTYRSQGGAAADFPGYPSWSGVDCDRLEGFSRMMPLFGAWVQGGRSAQLRLVDGQVDVTAEFRRGLLTGTDPEHAEYWGPMSGTSNQRIVEAADVALALWLFREAVWETLEAEQRGQVLHWLAEAEEQEGLDNNWQLFFVLIDRVLAALGEPARIPSARRRYERVKTFYGGHGWFRDGPQGQVDYYNAWGFHYALAWIDRIDPVWDHEFITTARKRFLEDFVHLVTPEGFPVLGRSVIYRLAVASPLILGCEDPGAPVSCGQARRALDASWGHYIRQGAVRAGQLTQGYYREDVRLLDPYSGPASPLWSLRSLVAALAYPDAHEFWQSAPEPLPVERGDFQVRLVDPCWEVRGQQATGEVVVEVLDNDAGACPTLPPLSRRERWQRAGGKAPRPRAGEAAYGRRHYSNRQPFTES